ncbi:radical SAM protein [Candidatus Woesearchaeota archaeon]|nr:radical SAM protein [Candidatus Woesearchaeota archaeon]
MRNIPKKAGFLDYSSCNARCNHCNRGALNGLEDNISNEKVLENIEILKSRGIVKFNFSGGEPTLNPNLDKFIECASEENEKGNKRSVGISTNGSWGDKAEEVLARYHKIGVSRVGLSIDGTEKTHDSIRGFPGLYSKVKNIIETAILYREKNILTPYIHINVTAQPRNVDELEGIAREFTEKGFHVSITFVTRYGRGWNLGLSEEQVGKIREVRRYLEERGVNIDPEVDLNRLYKYSFDEFKKRPKCARYEKGFERVLLSSDGGVFLCSHFFTPYAVILGNVKEKRLDLILDDFKKGDKKDFYWLFIDPSGEGEKRKFLEELETGRYEGIRWSKKCIPCSILSSFVYFRKQGYNIDEANDLTENIAKGEKIPKKL